MKIDASEADGDAYLCSEIHLELLSHNRASACSAVVAG